VVFSLKSVSASDASARFPSARSGGAPEYQRRGWLPGPRGGPHAGGASPAPTRARALRRKFYGSATSPAQTQSAEVVLLIHLELGSDGR
jgi:hypothetical protein